MKFKRVMAVTRKTLRSLKHDRRTAGFLVLMPLFMIAIFGYTFGGELKDISVYIVNLDEGTVNGSTSASIIDELQSGEVLRILEPSLPDGYAQSVDSVVGNVRDGDAWAVIVFPQNFSSNVESAIDGPADHLSSIHGILMIYIDASNPNIASAIITEVQTTVQQVLLTQYDIASPVIVSQNMVYGEGAEFIDFFAPGVMGLAAMMVTFMLSIISFVHERSTGTLDRLLTTPLTEGEIVAGYAIALGVVGLIQSLVILSTAILLFQVQIVGSALLVLLVVFLLGVGNQGLGFLLSSIAKNEFQAVQFMPLILFPSILLAGVFWPIEAVPDLLRPVSNFIPLTYAVEGCRSIMIRGWGIGEVWPEVTVLICFAAAMLLLSTYGLRRRR